MKFNRRNFFGAAAGAGAVAIANPSLSSAAEVSDDALHQAGLKPVLDVSDFKSPVIIESIDLLRKGRIYIIRVRSKDGAEGISIDNGRMPMLHPILNNMVIPYFVGKDARNLEEDLFGVYRERDNYKYQGLPFWCPVAVVEFAILDMLGRMNKKPLGAMLGGVIRDSAPFYIASGRRDTTPEQEIDYLKSLVDESGAKAIKYRVGGRMSRNVDAMPGRTERLIPLTRKAFGDQMGIHADSNSSYDPPQAIEVGRRLEDIGALFFEEPCPFDDFDATKKVTDALTIPIALGEQESSHWRYKQQIAHHVSDIVQPDLFYYGGLIRSLKVANMAELAGMPTTPHLSDGFGFVYSLHFVSCAKNVGSHQEYKKGIETYGQWFDPPLKIVDGALTIPKGSGVGIADPKEVIKDAVIVKS